MKLWNYIVLTSAMAIILTLAGFNIPGFTDLFALLGIEFTNQGITAISNNSNFFNLLFSSTGGLLVALGSTTAIAIGLFYTSRDKSFLILPYITGTVYIWISVFISIGNYATQTGEYWIGVVVGGLIAFLSFGFIQSCVDYFMGTTD